VKRNKALGWILALSLSLYAFLLVSQKIVLVTADLGRHLKNGEIFLTTLTIPRRNFYSYTHPNFPVINHHWGSGVIFYLLYQLGSFPLLSIIYGFLVSLAVFLIFRAALIVGSTWESFLSLLLALPLISYRTEVRPEGFSFLFFSLDFYLLLKFLKSQISFKKLALFYLLIQLVWANLHLFFVFGPFLVAIAIVEAISSNRDKLRQLFFLALASFLINLINPSFLSGLLEPLLIFKNYGYMLIENQSIFFAQRRLGGYVFFQVELLAVIAAAALAFLIFRFRKKTNWFLILILIFSMILAFRFIRAIPLFGLSLVPFLSHFLYQLSKEKPPLRSLLPTGSLFLLFLLFWLSLCFNWPYSPFYLSRFGFGLAPGVAGAADFFRRSRLSGPIFNNYDIGGYLIFYLYPKERVFVDNRPEAYPASFFREIYIAAQEKEEIWRQIEEQYRFNTIFFYRHDATPWAQPFLIRRLKDPDWVPVYVDSYSLILVRNNSQNQEVIKKFRLPQELFQISRS